jgi:hypothetical protein
LEPSVSRFGLPRDDSVPVASFSPFAFEKDLNPVIHAKYLQSYKYTHIFGIAATCDEISAPTSDDNNNSEQFHSNTPTTSGSSLDDSGSSVVDEQLYSNNPPASESSLNNSLSPTSPPPEQLTHSEQSNTARGYQLSCGTCGDTFGRHCDLKYV